MDFTDVIASIEKENPAGAQVLTDFQTANNNALSRVSDLEKDLKTSAEKRDRLKHIIRGATGLEDITEESLTEILAAGDGQGEVYKKEIEQLQGKLLDSANAVDGVTADFQGQIFNLQLDKTVTTLGAANEVHNLNAYGVLLAELSKGATFDGKDIVYKNEDGTTVYADGGNPATVFSKYEELRADENFAYLFKEQYQKGGGKTPSGPTTTTSGETLRRSTLEDTDKIKYIAKHGMDSYKQLPY